MKRIRLGTLILLVVLVLLGSALIVRQRREARLRQALAAYKRRAQGQLVRDLGAGWHKIDWPDGTTLEDAIDVIKSRTTTSWPKGIPILVDPDALRRAGKTLKSPLKGIPPDPAWTIPFRRRLRAVLEPMGLAYEVKDGTILITTPDAIENPDIEALEDDEGSAP